MSPLGYLHLEYLRAVAREGGVTAAAEALPSWRTGSVKDSRRAWTASPFSFPRRATLCAAPSIIHDDIRVRYAVERVGRAEGILERFYAITTDRRIKHPAVVAITESARIELSGGE